MNYIERFPTAILIMKLLLNNTPIADGELLTAYSLVDLIAEKYRVTFQQIPGNRYRRQEIYDLSFLILNPKLNDEVKAKILITLINKRQARDINLSPGSIDEPEIRLFSDSEWDTLKLEFGEIPDFNSCF